MAGEGLSTEELKAFLAEVFAPWVQQLRIEPVEVTETGALFRVPENPDLARVGGIVSGQAVAAIADTAGVLALMAHNRERRLMTTVDMTTHFMRPLMTGILEAEVAILSNGRRLATVRVDVRQAGSARICAGATCAYAYVETA